jgi:phosphoribosylformimino-5-aminoimidazole carboxamide ribonucleotide (ProFAR) isomerase
MIAIPSIDLRNGSCVKPTGLQNGATDLPIGDAIGMARSWAAHGFHRLQVVDRDAESASGSNASVIEDVVRDGAVEVQVAGGVQSLEQIERLADAGAMRVVVGDRALDEMDWLAHVAELFPGLLIVSTDVRERRVVTRGWVHDLPVDILDLVDELAGIPLGGLVIASALPGGRHSSGELALLEDVTEACEFPVIASGGVLSMDDLRALEHRGIAGAVLGTILYSGALDPRAVANEFAD